MKKVLKLVTVICFVLLIKFTFTYAINEVIIYNYKNHNYNTKMVKILYLFNFYQKYNVYYNEGNILYQTNDFGNAIKKYQIALNKRPPKNKVCDIRINLSLSIIKNINSNNNTEILDNLLSARNNLYENNCASPIDNSGKSETAEKLEEEIKQLEEQLKNNSTSNTPNNNSNTSSKGEEDFKEIEEKLKQNEQNSNASRQNELNTYENMGKYDYYSGKKW